MIIIFVLVGNSETLTTNCELHVHVQNTYITVLTINITSNYIFLYQAEFFSGLYTNCLEYTNISRKWTLVNHFV